MTSLVTATLWWWWERRRKTFTFPLCAHTRAQLWIIKRKSLSSCVREVRPPALMPYLSALSPATCLCSSCIPLDGSAVFTGELWGTQELMRHLSPSKSKELFICIRKLLELFIRLSVDSEVFCFVLKCSTLLGKTEFEELGIFYLFHNFYKIV